MGERWTQDGPRHGPKIELKRGRGVKNRVLTLLNRSRTLLDAIFSASSASFSHLQRSEADLTPHVRSVLALLHPNEPRKALLSPSWGRLGTQNGPQGAKDGPKMGNGSKIELKRGRGVKNRVLTLLTRSITHLDAIFSHLQRSEADLTPHVRSVLALLHPNEPRKAL